MFSTPHKAGTGHSFHSSELLSDSTKCHQCWVREQGCLTPKTTFFLLRRWLTHDSESGGGAKPINRSLWYQRCLWICFLLVFLEDFSPRSSEPKIGAALQMPTNHWGEFCQRRQERKINVGFCSLKLGPVRGLPGMPQAASKAHCGKSPDVRESLTGELPSEEAF